MSKTLAILAVLAATLAGGQAKAEFIKFASCQDQLADSRSSDTETAGRGFQQWVACVNGR